MLECLKNHQKDLSPECHKTIFNREKEEMLDNSIDYALVSTCKTMIKKYCADSDMSQVSIIKFWTIILIFLVFAFLYNFSDAN